MKNTSIGKKIPLPTKVFYKHCCSTKIQGWKIKSNLFTADCCSSLLLLITMIMMREAATIGGAKYFPT